MMNRFRFTNRMLCAATAAVLCASLAACGKHEIPINTRPVTRSSPEAVEADTVLESLPDESAGDSTADTGAESKKSKKKKKK